MEIKNFPSNKTVDLEEFLYSEFKDENIIIIFNLFKDTEIFPFIGEKSLNKFFSSLGYHKLQFPREISHYFGNIEDNRVEAVSNAYYNNVDKSYIFSCFWKWEFDVDAENSDKNSFSLKFTGFCPISIQLIYKGTYEDFFKNFLELLFFYPKKVIFYNEYDLPEEETFFWDNLIEMYKKKYKTKISKFYKSYDFFDYLSSVDILFDIPHFNRFP